MTRLLYTTCHPWLERSDLCIFKLLGFDVFSTGYFQNPQEPSSSYVTGLNFKPNPDLFNLFKQLNPHYTYGYKVPLLLTKEFVDQFDVIVITWRYDYLQENFDLLKDKVVILQTVGQSSPERERQLTQARKRGTKIVRISELEGNFPNYAGHDAIIDLAVDITLFKNWLGTDPCVLSVNKGMHRKVQCNVGPYLEVTSGFPRKLYGVDNGSFSYSFNLGPISPQGLVEAYSKARLVFSLGTKPAPVTLTFKEALAAGCPIVTWGPKLGNGVYKTYAAHTYISNGINGYYSDDIPTLRQHVRDLLNSHSLAAGISREARKTAENNFSIPVIAERWKCFFKEIGVL